MELEISRTHRPTKRVAMRLEVRRITDLALRSVLSLAEEARDEPTRGASLAAKLGTTTSYLPQVMRPLVRAGWVSSDPGPRGGYILTADPQSITLLMLIEAMEGPTRDDRCVLRGTPCPAVDACAMHEAWSRAREALLGELGQTSLAGLS